MTNEALILGATGRSGRAVAARLDAAGIPLVLAGRSVKTLDALAAELGGRPRISVGSLDDILATLETDAPGVVVNTVGPFARTGLRVARACPPGTHYVDLANEFSAVDDILGLDRQAATAGQVLVTGAGYGVLGTEAVVLRLCEGHPRPISVRVDAIPTIAFDGGRLGDAFAGSIVEVLEFGGREVRGARLVRSATGSHPLALVTPDGDRMHTGGGANGDLLAAWRATGADVVIAGSTAAPTGVLMRTVAVPALSALIRVPGVAGFLRRRISAIAPKAGPKARRSSWGHARAEWSDGTVREGWLRAGDGSDFTADVMTEITRRLLNGEGRPGAHTPGALFGPELAEAVGGEFIIEGEDRPTNSAAVLGAAYAPLTVSPASYTSPAADQIVIRNRAVAVNPLDAIKQSTGDLMFRWLPYPSVLGEDVAGEVVEVGSAVSRFSVGDRVVGYAIGMEKGSDPRAEGGFQKYTVLRASLAAPIPDGLTFADAAVLPLAISTAASALFQQDQLGLRHPTADAAPTGQAVVVWGGSTSVGSNAIQLAVAAGYTVATTASPHNHERMRRLGATHVVDYASNTAASDIAAALRGTPVAGVFAVGTGSAEPSVAVAIATGAKRVSLASPSVSIESVPQGAGRLVGLARMGSTLVAGNVALQVRSRLHGIRTRFVWGSSLKDNEVGPMLWERFLPGALADGRYRCAPDAEVVGDGLASVQVALERLKAGVSAKKLVVTL